MREVATVAVLADVSTPAKTVSDLGSQRIIGYPVSDARVLHGDKTASVDMVLFNVAATSEPLAPGSYILFLMPSPDSAHQFFVVYGIRGAYLVRSGQVHPVCATPRSPGKPEVGDDSVPLDSVLSLLEQMPLAGG